MVGHSAGFESRPARAFTLLEVTIAIGVFFIAIFAILGLTTQNLRSARSLNVQPVDITSVVSDLMLTNRLEEGTETGDFGELYPDWIWTRDVYEISTNGLYQIDVTVVRPGDQTTVSLWLYRPESIQRIGLRPR